MQLPNSELTFCQHLSTMVQIFDSGIPVRLANGIVILATVISVMAWLIFKDKRLKITLLIWITACLFLMLYSTVLGREQLDTFSIRLTPFWSINAIESGTTATMYEKIYNFIFFMPYGCLLGLYRKKKVLQYSLILGSMTSITIELLQLITRTGTCEIDDVMCNTLGCFLGSAFVYGVNKAVTQIRKG